MNTVADLKRALSVGTVVQVDNLRHPTLSGPRTVLKAQTNSWCLSYPAGHPKRVENPGERDGSWLQVPKRAEVRFEGDTAVFVRDGIEWLRVTITPTEGSNA